MLTRCSLSIPFLQKPNHRFHFPSRSFSSQTDSEGLDVHQYCRAQVKKHDYEHYLIGLLQPSHAQDAYFAIRAFNIETVGVKELSKNANTGQMRLLWWRQTIKDLYKGGSSETVGHPVARALFEVMARSPLNKGWFLKLLDCRSRDLGGHSIHNLEDMDNYCEESTSPLIYLALESQGVKDIRLDHVASHIGKSLGLLNLLRGTPYHLKNRYTYLPSQLLANHNISEETLFRAHNTPEELKEVVLEVATHAKAHLDHAKELKADWKSPLLDSALAHHLLTSLEKNQFSILEVDWSKTLRSPGLYWSIFSRHWRSRV